MAPISTPHPTKKNVRPSSAAPKLQSHHSYSTPLYGTSSNISSGEGRSVTTADGLGGLGLRPKTQAGGPRSWKTSQHVDHYIEQAKNQRRSTLAAVDGIADTETAANAGTIHPNVGSLFKGKVS